MASDDATTLPPPSPEHRRAAAGQFERANQAVATGHYDYGLHLLVSCCKLDPANLIYRQALRRTQKAWYRNNMRGSWLAWLTAWPGRLRQRRARLAGDHLKVLEHGEEVLLRNPWDVGAQRAQADAADALGLLDLAVWSLEQARQKRPRDAGLNRALARLYERRGNFTQAVALWQLVRQAAPDDVEAAGKVKDLAAAETIARGGYEEAVTHAGERSPEAPVPVPGRQTQASPADRVEREAEPIRKRLEADPADRHAYLQLAAVFRRAGELERAAEVLNEGLARTGDSFEMSCDLADLEIEPFRRNLALAEERLRQEPDNPEMRQLRARLRKEINARELDLYRRKADRYPNDPGHRLEMGVRLLRAGQLDEAIPALQAAREGPRQRWQASYWLGHAFKQRGNAALALRNFEDAYQHLPATETAARKDLLFLLAQGAADAGDLARAVERATELANLDFAYRDVGRLLDEWQARLQAEAPK
jgi:tetratricopeptide (TPR) repeat protein